MPGKNVPHQNGFSAARRNFDPDDPEYIRAMQRPAVIAEDLNEMERRKRVHQILQSKGFVNQLEQLIVDERKRGARADDLQGLERLTELILPTTRSTNSSDPNSPRLYGLLGGPQILPIADLRGTAETSKYSKQERLLRTKFAALFRLVDHFQWHQGASNHATLRLSPETEEFLINPDGLFYRELSAGALAKVDSHGNVLDYGSERGSNVQLSDFALHLAIHSARPDLRCVLELQIPVVVAVASMQCGLLPICQEAMIVGRVSCHEFTDSSEDSRVVAGDLGPRNKVLLVRNKGFFVGGQSVEEVFHLAYHLVLACETQVRAVRAGLDNLCIPSEDAQRRTYETTQSGGGGVNRTSNKEDAIKWRVGELEWEAWMRVLDNAGHRTGHIYRQNLTKIKAPAAQSDVEVPPAACAYGLLDERTEPDRVIQMGSGPKVRWLNTPNSYQKVEFEETGTAQPKKLTKWVPDATSESHSNPIKIVSPHQFTLFSQDPKEFKVKQKAIKEARRADKVSAGPQSKILEGVTWEEATKMKDAETSGTQEMIIIGAVSRGIIDPEYRHNAQVYRQLYQPNPFASVTDEEIQSYMRDVDRQHGRAASSGMSDSSFEEVSLMQAARGRERTFAEEPRELTATMMSDSTVREVSDLSSPKRTTASSTRQASAVSKVQPSSLGGWFQRSKSDRFGMKKNGKDVTPRQTLETIRGTASDEETQKDSSQEKKKKRFKTPSFLRSKKDKDSKKKVDR